MATRSNDSDDRENRALYEANRRLRAALDQCQALLKRTEEMLRDSEQDNDRPHSD